MAMKWRSTAALLVLAVATAWAAGPIAEAQDPAVDPAAVQMLKRMTDYMAGLQQFRLLTEATLEDQLDSGQRVDYDIATNVVVRRPDKLKARRVGGLIDQVFCYDGKTLTLHKPSEGVYASQAAPATIGGMIDYLREELGLQIPGSDVVYLNAFDIMMSGVRSATVVGRAVIAGTTCRHLAFSRPDVDFQVWVADGDRPLPWKYVVTDKSTPELISTVIVMTEWDVSSVPPDSEFKFVPPAGAKAITFEQMDKSLDSRP
jgi:hypothetical protein